MTKYQLKYSLVIIFKRFITDMYIINQKSVLKVTTIKSFVYPTDQNHIRNHKISDKN